MNCKFVTRIFAICCCIIVTCADLPDINDDQIFVISGKNQLRRHSHIDIPNSTLIQVQDVAVESLNLFLSVTSRLEKERIDLARKPSPRRDDETGRSVLPLPDTYLVVNGTSYRTSNAFYFADVNVRATHKTVDYAVLKTKTCEGIPEDNPAVAAPKQPASKITIEQQIQLKKFTIQGNLIDDSICSSSTCFILIKFDNVVMMAVHERILTKREILTSSFNEDLTIETIRTSIYNPHMEPKLLTDVSETTDILPTVAEVWMGPIINEIKTRHLLAEIIDQSAINFRQHIRNSLHIFVEEIKNIISNPSVIYDSNYDETYLDVVRFSNISTEFFDRLTLEYYESVIERKEACNSCDFSFTHFFWINFKIQATSMSFPIVRFANWQSIAEEEGFKMKLAANAGIPVRGLQIKFELDSDKLGVPLSITKKYRIDINFIFSNADPHKRIYLKVQRKLNKLLARDFRVRINNVLFGKKHS